MTEKDKIIHIAAELDGIGKAWLGEELIQIYDNLTSDDIRKDQAIDKLKSALSGLIGAETKEELDAMEHAIRSTVAPDSDKASVINAIDALRVCI